MSDRSYRIRDLFFRHVAQTSSAPLALEIERAEGSYLYTSDGKRILDMVSGVSVSNTGHGNPKIVEAVKKQAESYMHLMVYGEMIQAPQSEHAALLASILDPSLDSIYYLNSGSEANEAALKLAKRATGRSEIISFKNSYHGSTHGALSVMGNEEFKRAFRPLLPGVRQINFNRFEDLQHITDRVAAVIMEPIMAEAGVIAPVRGYLRAVRERCSEVGALLIFDEVQTGMGRCGGWFVHQREGILPDILTLAKALGGGMPLGAVIASNSLMKLWQSNPPLGHITTFGGHPVCCAAALAALKLLKEEPWIEQVEEKREMIRESLRGFDPIVQVRAEGLLVAVDLGRKKYLEQLFPLLIEEGVLSDPFLFAPTSFRLAPPLSISNEELEEGLEAIKRALMRVRE